MIRALGTRARSPAFLVAAMVLLAINLRPAAAAVGPLIHRIRDDTGLSSAGAGLLVALPVLCFGALAPLAPPLARRLGARATIAGALAVLVLGLLVRLVPGAAFLFGGTFLAGAAIAVGNVLLPVLVRRDFPGRTGFVTGLYSSALIGFAALSAGLSVPIVKAMGGAWRPALAIWAAPAGVALIVWTLGIRRQDGSSAPVTQQLGGATALLRDRLAWAVTLFFALQSASFYTTVAWLPSVFQSHGASEAQAGLLLSVTILVGVPAALTVPALAARFRDQRALIVVFTAFIALGWLGLLTAPMAAPYLWAVLLGLGQNTCFPLALTLIVLRGGSVISTSGLSTMVQTIGYLMAAGAPFAIGALHDLTGSWTWSLIVLLALVAPQMLVGLAAGRDTRVTPVAVETA